MCVVIYVTIVFIYVIILLIELNEVANVIIICDCSMFRRKSKMKVHIFHPILWMDLGWMKT